MSVRNKRAEQLADRETIVPALIAQGATSKQAGAQLGVSSGTVEFHRANIMPELLARNVADLIRLMLAK